MNKQAYLQGAGKLKFTSISPAGTGRKVYIPFYLESAVTNYQVLTPTGLVTTSTSYPNILLSPPAANGATNTAILKTPQISWALLRFIGFVTSINTPSIPGFAAMDITFSDLKLGGSTNLFVHQDFASGELYDIGNSNPGFRYYPIIKSPNYMEVSVQGLGLTDSENISFSCAAICDVIYDDEYGAHLSGPYARPDAMNRGR